MSQLPLLQAGPECAPRRETVDVPSLGGAVIVRGLMASEAFAIEAVRSQAMRRVHAARADYRRTVAALPEGAPEPEFSPPELDFDELRAYGRCGPLLLACAVVVPSGLALYTAEQWETVAQNHPAAFAKLQNIAERLSGMQAEDVEKNSPSTPS